MSEGRNPVFHCYASGWPKPSFTWLKDGMEIKDGDALHSYVLTRRAKGLDSGLDLDILYVRQEHTGQYSCVARNRFGEEQHNINLFLESKYPVTYLSLAVLSLIANLLSSMSPMSRMFFYLLF